MNRSCVILQWKVDEGFFSRFSTCDIVDAELWGLYDGLCCAWDMGLLMVLIETDSLAVVHTLKIQATSASYNVMVRSIKDMLRRDWEVCVVHVYQESNRVADRVVALALNGRLI